MVECLIDRVSPLMPQSAASTFTHHLLTAPSGPTTQSTDGRDIKTTDLAHNRKMRESEKHPRLRPRKYAVTHLGGTRFRIVNQEKKQEIDEHPRRYRISGLGSTQIRIVDNSKRPQPRRCKYTITHLGGTRIRIDNEGKRTRANSQQMG